jgi:hypothetical protein
VKDTKLFKVLNDPSVSYFTKQIITDGLKKDPVDCIAYVKLALKTLKEEFRWRGYKV